MSSINFDNPWLLLIALPIILVLLVPFFITVRKDNRNFHNVTSAILHILIAVLVGFSAAGTTIKSIVTETDVYVVADLSYSTNKKLDVIDGYIDDLRKDLPLNTKLGVVCFGGEDSQVVHTPLGEKPKSVKESVEKLDTTSTDIVSALEFTGKIFKGDVVKRIVLITDAKQSDESDSNALKRAVDTLHASRVYVDAIYLDSNLAEDAKEVQVSSVDYSDKVYEGQDATVSVFIQSTVKTRATLTVLRGEEKIISQPIAVGVGMQNQLVSLPTDETGKFEYSVRLEEIEEDGSPFNNVCNFAQTVASEPATLFITGSTGDEAVLRQVYGDNYAEAVTVKYEGESVPYTVAQLCQYDEIVLSNLDVSRIPNYEMFIESLDTCVSLLGKSLIGLGNLSLQNTVDDSLIRLSNMLPVRYGSPVSESKMYAIVIDKSNSMQQVGKLDVAKKAAKQLVDLVDEDDYVAIYGFYGGVSEVHSKSLATDKKTIKDEIDAITGEHNTVMSGGLNEVIRLLESSSTVMETQVFLLTDGLNSASDWTASADSIVALKNTHDVTTSILGIRSEKNETSLKNLALQGGGKYWYVEDDTTLDEGVFVDISNNLGEVVVDDYNTVVDIEQVFDETLEGIDNAYFVKGYVASRPKANATTVLTAQHQRLNASSVTVPIYSYWEYGNGKTASFTSSFSGLWMEKWNKEGLDTLFFKNVFDVNTPTERIDAPFVTDITRQSGGASLEIRPALLKAGATVEVALRAPDGTRTEIPNVVFSSSVYTCAFAMPTVGEYVAEITYNYKGESYTLEKSMHVSYLAEYDCFTTFEASPLYKMLGANGTVSEDGKLKIVNDENEVGVQIVDLTMPMLIAAVSLFAVDVLIRKLKWADIRGLFRKVGKGGRS